VRTRLARAAVIFAGYTALGLFLSVANYLTYLSTTGEAHWGATVKRSLGEWYVWAALTPLILHLARRWPLHRAAAFANGSLHVLAMLAVGVGKLFLDQWVRVLLFGSAGYLLFTNLAFNFLVYWAIVAAAHGLRYYRTSRERELRASQLEARLAETQLQLLNMQLHPHFLFNTLNAISELVHEDPETADRMLSGLSLLLRETLEAGSAPAVVLSREVYLLRCYVHLQRARFGSRLDVRITVDDSVLDAAVPILLLQTLVENAIRHGLARRVTAGRIDVAIARENGRVAIRVRDDGQGLDAGRHEGVGLRNTRARLQALFGSDHALHVANAEQGGVLVTISCPYRTVDEIDTE
jgi:two-component sensor histidine kinase